MAKEYHKKWPYPKGTLAILKPTWVSVFDKILVKTTTKASLARHGEWIVKIRRAEPPRISLGAWSVSFLQKVRVKKGTI
jgi:hypothetical protein